MTDLWYKKQWFKIVLVCVVLCIPLLYLFSPMIFDGKEPSGVDSTAGKASTHLYKQWEEQSGETALWNPNIFGGMPIYPRISPRIMNVDTLIIYLGKVVYRYFWVFLSGGLGMFFLLRYRKLPWYFGLISALAFILLPHWIALIHVGHFAKLRAFMALPWLLLSFNYLFDKRSWLSVGLFAAAFAWITRTQHFQVVFYGIMVLIFAFLLPVVRLLIQKEYKKFGDLLLKLAVAVVLTIAVSSQPFMSLKEYTPYSTRGGNSISLQNGQAAGQNDKKGVGFDYATRWSLDSKGAVAFVIPRFAGGLVQETYRGSKFPQLKDRAVPGYWGEMPFTQSYDFMGMLVLILALAGSIIYWKQSRFVKSLSIFNIFALLLAFGRHFPALYKLFYNYMPYFSKFRVPSMIVNVIFILCIILAAYGLKGLFEKAKEGQWKFIAQLFGGAVSVLLLLLVFNNSFAFAKAGEAARYGASMQMVQSIRQEMMVQDLWRAIILCILAGSVLIAASFNKIKPIFAGVLLTALLLTEIFTVNTWAYEQMTLGNPVLQERRDFKQSDISRYLQAQPQDARAFALGGDSNYYSYFYPTISGYSAIKLQTIQDLRENCLFVNGAINWNVVNMLSGKYIIAPGRLEEEFLTPIAGDKNRNEVLYKNTSALPKAWLVKQIRYMSDQASVMTELNKKTFQAQNTAFINGEGADRSFTAEGSISLSVNTPDHMEYAVDISQPQFAVFSEMHYPKGWSLKIEDKELDIHQVDYCLRGAALPEGKYKLVMDFHPRTYYSGMLVVRIANIIMLLLIAVPLVLAVIDGRRKKLNA